MDDNLVYALSDSMTNACKIYEKGERKSLKNWAGMNDMETFFAEEIQTIKDLLADSAWEVTAS